MLKFYFTVLFIIINSILTGACVTNSAQIIAGDNTKESGLVSDLKSDEELVFFQTSAWLDEQSKMWHIPIHGWVYEPENSAVRKSLFANFLKIKYGLEADPVTQMNFDRRVNLMIADNERGKRIIIKIGETKCQLSPSEPNGQFYSVIKMSYEQVTVLAKDNAIEYSAITKDGEKRKFYGRAILIYPKGLSIISDIDDTIKISQVTDRKLLFKNTFFQNFKAVPDMPYLYKYWTDENIPVHYVSSSPWQLYEPLKEFMTGNNFPWTTFSLKSIRFRDRTFFELFKKGTQTKPPQMMRILDRYPDRKFILIGDSGEQDPEVYAAILRSRPDQILKIYIRNITNESLNNQRFKKILSHSEKFKWELFFDPKSLDIAAVKKRLL